jgi:internalin A
MTEAELLNLIAQAKDEQWEELDLSGHSLTELPPQIGELTQLKRLILGKWDKEKKAWVGVGLKTLPGELERLVNLEELTLSGNQLTEIQSCVTNLIDLDVLNIAQNQLTDIPGTLTKLTKLTKLTLWGNQVSEIPEECIPLLR